MVSKSFLSGGAQKLEFAMQPVISLDRLSFDSFAMKDVDHDVLRKLSSLEAHSTSNMRKLAIVYRDVVDGKAATGEKSLFGMSTRNVATLL